MLQVQTATSPNTKHKCFSLATPEPTNNLDHPYLKRDASYQPTPTLHPANNPRRVQTPATEPNCAWPPTDPGPLLQQDESQLHPASRLDPNNRSPTKSLARLVLR